KTLGCDSERVDQGLVLVVCEFHRRSLLGFAALRLVVCVVVTRDEAIAVLGRALDLAAVLVAHGRLRAFRGREWVVRVAAHGASSSVSRLPGPGVEGLHPPVAVAVFQFLVLPALQGDHLLRGLLFPVLVEQVLRRASTNTG